MSKEDIIKLIGILDEELKQNQEVGFVYIPTSKILLDMRNSLIDELWYEYGIVYI